MRCRVIRTAISGRTIAAALAVRCFAEISRRRIRVDTSLSREQWTARGGIDSFLKRCIRWRTIKSNNEDRRWIPHSCFTESFVLRAFSRILWTTSCHQRGHWLKSQARQTKLSRNSYDWKRKKRQTGLIISHGMCSVSWFCEASNLADGIVTLLTVSVLPSFVASFLQAFIVHGPHEAFVFTHGYVDEADVNARAMSEAKVQFSTSCLSRVECYLRT